LSGLRGEAPRDEEGGCMNIFAVADGPMNDMVNSYAAKLEAKRLAKMSWCYVCKKKVNALKTHLQRRDHQGYRMALALENVLKEKAWARGEEY